MPRNPLLAHPLTQPGELPVSSLFVATVAMCLLAGAGYLFAVRARRNGADLEQREEVVPPGFEPLPRGAAGIVFGITRLAGLGLLVLAIVAGRFGQDDQLDNITPALVIGAGWPLLVVACLVFGHVWWWINPFDTLARGVAPLGAGDGTSVPAEAPSTWAAVPVAGLWVAYLTVWPNSLSPRTIANALLVYTVVTLAGCLAVGRRTWLGSAELFTVFFGWVARARRGGRGWTPSRGASVVLGVLAGGMVYGLVRDSRLLVSFSYGSLLELSLVLATFSAAAALLAVRAEQRQRIRSGVAAVALALIPATAAIAIALGLARNRFTTSLQLLPAQAFDPLGVRPDSFVAPIVDPQPLGHEGLLALQVIVLLLGHIAGMALAARATARGTTLPAPMLTILPTLSVLAVLVGAGVAAVTAT